MNLRTKLTILMATGLLCNGSITHAATLYAENFNDPLKTTLGDFDWGEFRGGNPSGPSLNSSGASTAIQAGERVLFMNINTTSSTTSWFAGLRHVYGSALPNSVPLSELSLSANVWGGGSVGPIGDVTLRLESSTNNWIGWTIAGTTLAANPGLQVGGLLSETTNSAGTFDASATSFNIVLAYANTITTWGNDSSNIIALDNVNFSVIPEPSSTALVLLAFLALAFCARRQMRRTGTAR